MKFLLAFLTILVLCDCSKKISEIEKKPNQNLESILIKLKEKPKKFHVSDPNYEFALEFDSLIKEKLTHSQKLKLINNCKKNKKTNPFCPSIVNIKRILRFKKQYPKISVPEKKDIKIVSSISNWRKLRKEKIPILIESLKNSDINELKILAGKAIKEKYCPNNICIAIAATLEEFAPDKYPYENIAELYSFCSRCFYKKPVDYENYIIRGALFYYLTNNYRKAEKILKFVTPSDPFIARAPYWLYRVKTKLRKNKEATKILNRLLKKYPLSFHTIVAIPNIDEFILKKTTFNIRQRLNKFIENFILQIQTLNKFGFEDSASILIKWMLSKNLSLSLKINLYSMGNGELKTTLLPLAIMNNSQILNEQVLKLSYPLEYNEFFNSTNFGINPLLLISLARQESNLDPKAISNRGATGLMQIMPYEAERLAPNLKDIDLSDPRQNIAIGSYRLKELLEQFNNDIILAIAAYNAGPENVINWQKRLGSLEPILFIDMIPFRETRNFVSSVLANYYWYNKLYRPQDKNPLIDILKIPKKVNFQISLANKKTKKTHHYYKTNQKLNKLILPEIPQLE